MRDVVRVGVPPMSAYQHLVHFEEYPRFMSSVLSLSPLDRSVARMALDIGGRRVELDAVLDSTEPGRLVHWDSAVLTETFRLEEAEGRGTDVFAVVELDDSQVAMVDSAPETVVRNRLREDLKGLKRFCEEAEPD
ncbi:SRPBCC family protein [Dactylosporangium sp. NPDC005572]|uniref:SRPBCC family protein n=1 Tax=Dactylosporangium sp. NPDC005572 TaxID=3156889 RepID=UPI0033BA538F